LAYQSVELFTSQSSGPTPSMIHCDIKLHRDIGDEAHPVLEMYEATTCSYNDAWLKVSACQAFAAACNTRCPDLNMQQVLAKLQNSVLYMEASEASASNLMPRPTAGADVWLDVDPNDGFVFERSGQVPGCSLDRQVEPLDAMRRHDLYWEEPESHVPQQYSDNGVNFNLQQYNDLWPSSGSGLGVSWLRGHPICVKAAHVDEMYTHWVAMDPYPSNLTSRFLRVAEPGWECPVGYKGVENYKQCENAQMGIGSTGRSATWVDPAEFVAGRDTSNVDIGQFLPGCQVLPDSFSQDVYFSLPPVSTNPVWQFTFNPDPTRQPVTTCITGAETARGCCSTVMPYVFTKMIFACTTTTTRW